MREVELSRMNFMISRRGPVTYKNMLLMFVLWCLILAGAYGSEMWREARMFNKIEIAKKTIVTLQEQQVQQLKVVETLGREKVDVSSKEDLSAILLTRPKWSKILRALTTNLPPQMWLESVSVSYDKDAAAHLTLFGKVRSQNLLMNYIKRLEMEEKFMGSSIEGAKSALGADGFFDYEMFTTPVMKKF